MSGVLLSCVPSLQTLRPLHKFLSCISNKAYRLVLSFFDQPLIYNKQEADWLGVRLLTLGTEPGNQTLASVTINPNSQDLIHN